MQQLDVEASAEDLEYYIEQVCDISTAVPMAKLMVSSRKAKKSALYMLFCKKYLLIIGQYRLVDRCRHSAMNGFEFSDYSSRSGGTITFKNLKFQGMLNPFLVH